MKALTLYIDKWYIIGAVCTDGVPRLVKPKNGEECFWLYFYEDSANDEIVYGIDNKRHYHNHDIHYYGDVFQLLTDEAFFYKYGLKQSINKIFKASGIIDELKSAVGSSEGNIEVYVSFARDISDAARLVFLKDVLIPEGFDVKQSVARIGHLALEHAYRKAVFSEAGYYLLLNACNENLVYSLYELKDGLFLRKAEKSLTGMGTDLRSRALIENVVSSINRRNHFLQTHEELEKEYLRLSQFVDSWIIRLENARPGRPVIIPNVSFSNIGNTYQATVLKKDIDGRTHAIVEDIIREIVTFVRDNQVNNVDMKGILFLGNTFTNSQFLTTIKANYTLPDSSFVCYKRQDLPNIVAVYTQMDCNQFATATQHSERQGEAELERQRIAREEAERQKKAEEERSQRRERERAAQEADKRYEEAMQYIYDFEKKQDYAQMSDWADIALQHRPNDEEATQKKAEAVRLLSDQKVREEQYRTIIGRAQDSWKNKQWQDALSQSEAALNLNPASVEAKRIYDLAKKHIETEKEIDKYINRSDLFLAQKAYDEALRELAKVQSLDSENAEAARRITEIEDIRKKHNTILATLVKEYEEAKKAHNYDDAIDICEKLAEHDALNQRKWSAETEKLKADRDKALEAKKRFDDLKKKAMDADFREDWVKVCSLCEELLEIKEDVSVRNLLEKASNMIRERKVKKAKEIGELLSKLKEREEDFDYKGAIEYCHRLIIVDEEEPEKWKEQLQRLQSLQIEKSDLEINFRRKKADINVIIRNGDKKEAERQIIAMRKKYWEYGIKEHDVDFQKLLASLYPQKKGLKEDDSGMRRKEDIKKGDIQKGKKITIKKPSIKGTDKNKIPDSEGFKLLQAKQYVKAKRIFATTEKNTEMVSVCRDLMSLEKAVNDGTITKQQQKKLSDLYKKYYIT